MKKLYYQDKPFKAILLENLFQIILVVITINIITVFSIKINQIITLVCIIISIVLKILYELNKYAISKKEFMFDEFMPIGEYEFIKKSKQHIMISNQDNYYIIRISDIAGVFNKENIMKKTVIKLIDKKEISLYEQNDLELLARELKTQIIQK